MEEMEEQCGICMEEIEIRGKLDSCEHFFCFDCIHEWSKRETRCPLCKQRFKKITKQGRNVGRSIIHLPVRDQVYVPAEEDIYESESREMCAVCYMSIHEQGMIVCAGCSNESAHMNCVDFSNGYWLCQTCYNYNQVGHATLRTAGRSVRRNASELSLRTRTGLERVELTLDANTLRLEAAQFRNTNSREAGEGQVQSRNIFSSEELSEASRARQEQDRSRQEELDRAWEMFDRARTIAASSSTETVARNPSARQAAPSMSLRQGRNVREPSTYGRRSYAHEHIGTASTGGESESSLQLRRAENPSCLHPVGVSSTRRGMRTTRPGALVNSEVDRQGGACERSVGTTRHSQSSVLAPSEDSQLEAGAAKRKLIVSDNDSAKRHKQENGKEAACKIVKELLKPLYAQRKLPRDEYKRIARTATHELLRLAGREESLRSQAKAVIESLGVTLN